MQVVDGNRLVATPYDLSFRKSIQSAVLCNQQLTSRQLDIFRRVILAVLSLLLALTALTKQQAEQRAAVCRLCGRITTSRCSMMICRYGGSLAA